MHRLCTGVVGLDDILLGGLPSGQMYLLQGYPGTGKTTLAMQFALAGVEAGEKSLYITLSEPRNELIASAESHGWDLARLPIVEFVPDEASLEPESQYTVFHPAEVELADTIKRLIDEIEMHQPDRLVLDSLSELRLIASDKMRYRRQIIALKQYLAHRSTTALLLDDSPVAGDDLHLQSVAHGVLSLTKLDRSYGIARRQIEVIKLRGSACREGRHDYRILTGGVAVYPRLVASEHTGDYPAEQIECGIAQLDAMLGGGIDRGSSVLITGPTGTAKSTLAMQYAVAAATRGDRASIYSFDEGLRSATKRAESLGMDLSTLLASGHLAMTQFNPAQMSPGELIWQIRDDVTTRDARFVVIDSLNGFLNAMPGEQDMLLHLHELFAFLAQKGVIAIIIHTQQGLVGTMRATFDVSYLADTVMLLRYFEMDGTVHQAVSVLKKRMGQHERSLRELTVSSTGISVGEPLLNLRGFLTGALEFVPEKADAESEAVSE